jgi:hypothetical protein
VTATTKVKESSLYFAVISQHPSVGKLMPVIMNCSSSVQPPFVSPESRGGEFPSSRLPVIFNGGCGSHRGS